MQEVQDSKQQMQAVMDEQAQQLQGLQQKIKDQQMR